MQTKIVLALKKYAFTIINIICVLVQMGVTMQFGMLVSGYYEADGSYTLMQWDEFTFPASVYNQIWVQTLLYSVVTLILVCTVRNRVIRIALTAISVVVSAFAAICLAHVA
ncbi:MAG: hypothetical protein LBL41_06020 [Bifidobacteriaceae bacterium]|jgi:hypothetical protein|nr:hypothetical protein [Bifidobacteriaceae bacterium]